MNGIPDVALVRLLGRNVRGLVIHERAERAARVDVRQRDVRDGARLLVQRVEVVLHGMSAKQHYHVILARAGSVLVVRYPGVPAIRQNSQTKGTKTTPNCHFRFWTDRDFSYANQTSKRFSIRSSIVATPVVFDSIGLHYISDCTEHLVRTHP